MIRNIEKELKRYHEQDHTNGKGAFYQTDIQQIRDRAINSNGQLDLFRAIGDALEVGYMVGYRAAQRERQTK